MLSLFLFFLFLDKILDEKKNNTIMYAQVPV